MPGTQVLPTDRWKIGLERADCEFQEMTSTDLEVLERTGEWCMFFIFKNYSSTLRRGKKTIISSKGPK